MARFPKIEMPNVHDAFSIVYKRISLSKLTIFYFTFSLLFAIVSVLLQSQAYQTNLAAANLFTTVIARSNSSTRGFALLERQGDELLWCTGYGNSRCQSLWSAEAQRSRIDDASYTGPDATQSVPLIPAITSLVNAPPLAAPTQLATTPTVNNQVQPIAPLVSQIGQAVNGLPPAPNAAPPATAPSTFPANNLAIIGIDDDRDDDEGEEDDDDERFEVDDDDLREAAIAQPKGIFNKRKRSPLSHSYVKSYPTTPHPVSAADLLKRQARISILVTKQDGNTTAQIQLNGATLILDQRCLLALNWPLETLENTKREDIVFIIFHIWVFGLSVVALLNESVVHMLANLLTHVLVAIWASFQLVHTRNFQRNYARIVTNGLCDGQNLLPKYWEDRARSEIPSAAINGLAFIVSTVLTWRLIRTYNWATFKRIGADRKISKVYKIVLSLSTVLQLLLFFALVSIALWIDQLCNGVFGQFAKFMMLYRGLYITIAILLVPWIILGWKAARMAHRMYMGIFIAFNVLLIGGWGAMFSSITFRYTFFQWQFFMLMEIAAVILLVVSLWLSIWTRMNFDVDLSRFLNPKNVDNDDGVHFVGGGVQRSNSKASSFQSADLDEKRVGGTGSYDEKIDYPFSNGSAGVPTYAAFTRNPSGPAASAPPPPPAPSGQLGYLGNSGPSLHDTLHRSESDRTTTSLQRSATQRSDSTVGSSESSKRRYLLE